MEEGNRTRFESARSALGKLRRACLQSALGTLAERTRKAVKSALAERASKAKSALAERASKAAEKTLAIPTVHVEEKAEQSRDDIRLAWLEKKPNRGTRTVVREITTSVKIV